MARQRRQTKEIGARCFIPSVYPCLRSCMVRCPRARLRRKAMRAVYGGAAHAACRSVCSAAAQRCMFVING